MDKVRFYMNYVIIGVVSLISLVFLPMLGSSVGLDWDIPNTAVGWIVWVTVKLIVAVLNVVIFYCFMQQAKVNVKDDENYKKAVAILMEQKDKDVIPRSPKKWTASQYGKKGTTIFVTTALSTVALTQAMLTFDYVAMLTFLFTIIMGLIFGILQMKTAEEYWTTEYLKYALMKKDEAEKGALEARKASVDKSIEENAKVSQNGCESLTEPNTTNKEVI